MPTGSDRTRAVRKLKRLAALFILVLVILAQSGVLLWAELGMVRLYRKIGSPISAKVIHCRYRPSCSAYGLQALERDGFWRGNLKIAGRLTMCSPIGMLIDAVSEPQPDVTTAPSRP